MYTLKNVFNGLIFFNNVVSNNNLILVVNNLEVVHKILQSFPTPLKCCTFTKHKGYKRMVVFLPHTFTGIKGGLSGSQ